MPPPPAIRDAFSATARHWADNLWGPAGAPARAYLAARSVEPSAARAFGLGWAPAAATDLGDALAPFGLQEPAQAAGLLFRRHHGPGYVDAFRGRLVFPVRDPAGALVGFVGRVLDDSRPKYLDTPYPKAAVPFGLDLAREEIHRLRSVVAVEGCFDVLALHQAGVRNVVALCHVALTPGQLAALAALGAEEVVTLFDGDRHGHAAVERARPALLASGLRARVALLPEGEDPDTYARRVGGAGLCEMLDAARKLLPAEPSEQLLDHGYRRHA